MIFRLLIVIALASLLAACDRSDSKAQQCEASKRVREHWAAANVETNEQLIKEIEEVLVDRPCAITGAALRKIVLDMERLR